MKKMMWIAGAALLACATPALADGPVFARAYLLQLPLAGQAG